MEKTLESRLDAKRKFKVCRTVSKVEAKIKRDCARMKKVAEAESMRYNKLLSFYEHEKAKMLDDG